MISLGTNVREQLSRLNIPADQLGAQLGQLSEQATLQSLGALTVGYGQAALSENRFSADLRDGRVDVPAAWSNPSPSEVAAGRGAFVASTYADGLKPQADKDTAAASALSGRSAGVGVARALGSDPVLRAAFEQKSALTVQDAGRSDGVISVSAGAPAQVRTTASAMTRTVSRPDIYGALARMDAALSWQAAKVGELQTQATNSSSSSTGAASSGGSASKSSRMDDLDVTGIPYYSNDDPLFSATTSTGRAQSTQSGSSSMDVQIMELQRMVEKRTQMYELVSKIFSSYDNSAKNAISNMKA